MSVLSAYSGYLSGRSVLMGLSNIAGLYTYEHGTNLLNYISIRIFGGDPTKGGGKTGSIAAVDECEIEKEFKDYEKGRFFISVDSELAGLRREGDLSVVDALSISANTLWGAASIPIGHSYLSSSQLLKINHTACNVLKTVLLWMVTPIVRFHMPLKPEDYGWENDRYYQRIKHPDFNVPAVCTTKAVAATNIGLLGILKNVNRDVVDRVRKNPQRFIRGALRIGAIAVYYYFNPPSTEALLGGCVGLLS